MLRLSGWDRALPLCDPMCGSGTILIEAAQWALGIAPGLVQARFGLERWASHDESERRLLRELREAARAGAKPPSETPVLEGSDADEAVLAIARQNAARAGVRIALARGDVRSLERRHERALLITNPPYGERLPRDRALADELAASFARLAGYRCCVLAHDRAILRAMKQKPAVEHALWNGALECRFLVWDV
jgi:putative N6-adenine-specific DNA methylase